jgi:hypothetical protein
MSEAQVSELILLEPGDGIMFIWRDVSRRSRPCSYQPDLHVERIGMDLPHRWGRRRRDTYPQLLPEFSGERCDRKLFRLHMTTRQVPYVGIPAPLSRSVTKQHPVGVPKERRYDAGPSSALRQNRHERILSAE